MGAAVGALVAAEAREHEAQVVEELGGGAKGGVHPGNARALAQGERCRHMAHLVDGGAADLSDAPARVGGERVEVAAAALGVESAERERAFARARYARDAHEGTRGECRR